MSLIQSIETDCEEFQKALRLELTGLRQVLTERLAAARGAN
jgi:hypothetical protein